MLPEYMLAKPTVFAVEDQYQIFVPFSEQVIMWVKVGDQIFYDDCNGILRSNTLMHKVLLPMRALDEAGSYTVVYKKIIERKPYRPTSEPEREITVSFRPVPKQGEIRLYHVADAHNMVDFPIAAGQYFGDSLDLLVLNGDLPNHSGDIRNFDAICYIASGITGGHCPVVFARGNHDTRGLHAEDMPNYIPTRNGWTYYTFRVGCVWGLVLDCGEDKDDSHEEYGGTVCFHQFRLRETEFIKEVIANAKKEYEAEGVQHRLVISHIGFTYIKKAPFDIENEIYTEWCRLMREYIQPELLLYGHYHKTYISPVGSDFDHRGQACTAIIGSKPIRDENKNGLGFVGCGIVLREDDKKRVIFNDHTGAVLSDEIID